MRREYSEEQRTTIIEAQKLYAAWANTPRMLHMTADGNLLKDLMKKRILSPNDHGELANLVRQYNTDTGERKPSPVHQQRQEALGRFAQEHGRHFREALNVAEAMFVAMSKDNKFKNELFPPKLALRQVRDALKNLEEGTVAGHHVSLEKPIRLAESYSEHLEAQGSEHAAAHRERVQWLKEQTRQLTTHFDTIKKTAPDQRKGRSPA
ncbi:hypothetical protein HYV43_06800 [Candidatus Micrarchaeota archaeon]|nr:hypothetical protein [Candidatus Micrarchaeota archaeon]